MTGPLNRPYERRFSDPAARFISNGALQRFDALNRRRIEEMVEWLDGREVVAEAEHLTVAEAARIERLRNWQRWETTTVDLRRGDPGE